MEAFAGTRWQKAPEDVAPRGLSGVWRAGGLEAWMVGEGRFGEACLWCEASEVRGF